MLKSFDGTYWKLYRWFFGIRWDKRGKFIGEPAVVANGGRNYLYKKNPVAPFAFQRSTGELIIPGTMVTDGGSVPTPLWSLGLDPWEYMPAYLIHDWDFMAHHAGLSTRTFSDANDTLAEAIYTLMLDGRVPQNWWNVVAVHAGVSSPFGLKVWNRRWSPSDLKLNLPEEKVCDPLSSLHSSLRPVPPPPLPSSTSSATTAPSSSG